MTESLSTRLEFQQQISAMFDNVFAEVCSIFDLRLPKPQLVPVVTIAWQMVYHWDHNKNFDTDFSERKPSIQLRT